MFCVSRLFVVVLLTVPATSFSAETVLSPDEAILRQAGVATDGPALLAFLKAQTPSADDQARLSAALGQLGHRSYALREKATRDLVAAGRPALAYLRPAVSDTDIEVARRAQRAIDEIERVSYA